MHLAKLSYRTCGGPDLDWTMINIENIKAIFHILQYIKFSWFSPWARKGHCAPPLGFYGIGIFRFLSMSS